MSANRSDIDALLEMMVDGRLNALSAEQVAALEAQLNASPEAAASLAGTKAEPPVSLATAVSRPCGAEWERVWSGIEAAAAQRSSHGRRGWRIVQAMTAVAACVVLGVVLEQARRNSTGEPRMQLATNVDIEEMEVLGDTTVQIESTGDGGAIIWVYDAADSEQGA